MDCNETNYKPNGYLPRSDTSKPRLSGSAIGILPLPTSLPCRRGGNGFGWQASEVPYTFRNRRNGKSKFTLRSIPDFVLLVSQLWMRSQDQPMSTFPLGQASLEDAAPSMGVSDGARSRHGRFLDGEIETHRVQDSAR